MLLTILYLTFSLLNHSVNGNFFIPFWNFVEIVIYFFFDLNQ